MATGSEGVVGAAGIEGVFVSDAQVNRAARAAAEAAGQASSTGAAGPFSAASGAAGPTGPTGSTAPQAPRGPPAAGPERPGRAVRLRGGDRCERTLRQPDADADQPAGELPVGGDHLRLRHPDGGEPDRRARSVTKVALFRDACYNVCIGFADAHILFWILSKSCAVNCSFPFTISVNRLQENGGK